MHIRIKKLLLLPFLSALFCLPMLSNGQKTAQNKQWTRIQKDSIAKDSLRRDSIKVDKNYVYSFILDARDIVVSPIYWDSKQWLVAGATCAVTTALIFSGEDKTIEVFSQKPSSTAAFNSWEKYVGDPLGAGEYPAIILGTAYLTSVIFHKPHLGQFSKLATKSVLLSAATATLIKMIAERDRPFQDEVANPLKWKGPVGLFANTSFPSGHSIVAWSFCSMVAMEYPHPIYIPILAYTAAAITSYGRINGNFHWASDVIFSAVLGYSISRLVFRHNNWGNYKRQVEMRYKE